MGFSIRDAGLDDLAIVATFLDQFLAGDYFMPYAQVRHVLGGRYHRTLLAVESGLIVGIAIMSRAQRTLVNLLVRPCERKRGIADALLFRLRVERIRVKMNVTDGDPTGYYLKRGYCMTSERTGKAHIRIAVVDLDSPPDWVHDALC